MCVPTHVSHCAPLKPKKNYRGEQSAREGGEARTRRRPPVAPRPPPLAPLPGPRRPPVAARPAAARPPACSSSPSVRPAPRRRSPARLLLVALRSPRALLPLARPPGPRRPRLVAPARSAVSAGRGGRRCHGAPSPQPRSGRGALSPSSYLDADPTAATDLEFSSSARNPSPPPPMATPLFHLHPWRPCCGRSQVSSPTTRTRTGCQALLVACVKGFNLVPLVFYQGRAGRHRHVPDPHLTLQRWARMIQMHIHLPRGIVLHYRM